MIKIILVDNHSIFREGMKLWIENVGLGEIVAEASNGYEFIDLLYRHTPDLVIMDFELPLINGVEATRIALKIQPEIKILGITLQNDLDKYTEMILAGATGFMLKTSGKDEFEKAIKSVVLGECYFSEDLIQMREKDLIFY
jgi:DNA-binding NarL/FixJ family response regulator